MLSKCTETPEFTVFQPNAALANALSNPEQYPDHIQTELQNLLWDAQAVIGMINAHNLQKQLTGDIDA